VAVVVPVEEPAFLLAMHRCVRRIQIQDQVRWRLPLRADQLVHQFLVHRPRTGPVLRVLEPR
jgi:hypothetical protein